jgi:hypothetical protein
MSIRKKLLGVSVFLLIGLLVSGCSSLNSDGLKPDIPLSPSGPEKKDIKVSLISWKDPYGRGGKCETGLDVSSYWYQGSSVTVYDAGSGALLADSTVTSSKNDPDSRLCTYETTFIIEEVNSYRFVFDGRYQIEKTLVDLKIMANEYPLASLLFVEERGA